MNNRIKPSHTRALKPAARRRSDDEFDQHIERLLGDVPSPSDASAGESYPSPAADLRAALVPFGTAVMLSVALVLGVAVSTPGV